MIAAEARELIAAYLSGTRCVPRAELADAHALLAADPAASLRRLGEALGAGTDSVNVCAIFRSRAAEFCSLSAQERAADMPGLLRHVENCAACRCIYWEVQSVWQPRGRLIKTLAEGLRVVLDATGSLFERGLCMPAIEEEFVAITAAEPVGSRRRTWRLEDAERACAITIELCAIEDEFEIFCTVEGAADSHLEILDNAGRRVFSGRITEPKTPPVRLIAGRWTVRVRAAGPDGPTWEIPLEFQMEGETAP